jgi:hypothetical protein
MSFLPDGWHNKAAVATADINRDGKLEIVVSAEQGLCAWQKGERWYEKMFPCIPYGNGADSEVLASPVLWDLDNDGDGEIIAAARDGKIYIVHHDGTAFTYNGFTWPKTLGGALRATPAVANIDFDGELEILVGSEDGNFYALKLDGSTVAGQWPINVGSPMRSSAAVGDIDVDIGLEIVVGADNGKVYAWYHDGTLVSGWPANLIVSHPIRSSPALADLNGDRKLETIIHGEGAYLEIFNYDGSRFAAWNPSVFVSGLYTRSPVVGDLDGDNTPEIIFGPLSSKVYAFHADGTLVNGFPRRLFTYVPRPVPLIADLDNDGRPELIVGNYIWNIPSNFNTDKQDWPTFHHDMSRTGYYPPPRHQICWIDPVLHGSSMADDVKVLRNFRDRYLLTNAPGRAFVKIYYGYSPTMMHYISQHRTLQLATRMALKPIVFMLRFPYAVGLIVIGLGIIIWRVKYRRSRQ